MTINEQEASAVAVAEFTGPIVRTKQHYSSNERNMLNLPILLTQALNAGDMTTTVSLTDKFMIEDVAIRTKGENNFLFIFH